MQQLSATLVQQLGDSDPEVRRQILRLEALHAGEQTALARLVPHLATSASEIDLQQLALSMGSPRVNVDTSAFTLMELLRNHGNDAHIRDAAYSSINARNIDTLLQSLSQSPEKVPARVFGDALRMAAAFEKGPAVIDAFESLLTTLVDDEKNRSPDAWESAVGVADQIRRSPKLMELVLQHGTAEATWNTACEAASDLSAETDESLSARLAALRFIEVSGHQTDNSKTKLLNLFSPEWPPQIQQGAISALARENSEQLYSQIYKRWKGLTPSVRATALDAILARPQRAIDLLTAIEEETLTVSDVAATYRERLLNHHDSTVREAAQRILGVTTPSARTTLVQNLQSAIADLKSNPTAGKAVFEKRCASCHKIGDVGQQIGADLAALKNRSTDALLTAILDPNRAVEAKFLSYTATTSNGRTFSGMLLNETGNSLTLLGTDGKEQVIARTDLEELACSSRSLMPEGLEKDLSPQDLADVISYVQSSETGWKRFDGNQPRLITASDDGILTLPASVAKIHGPNLVFEGKFQNLGWWLSTSDYAVWTIDVPKSGHWTVEFTYACDDSTAGNAIKLSTGTRLLTARVPGTGNWDTYRTWSVGQIDLGKGRRELIVTAPEQPTSALINLKSIRLRPPM